MYEWNSIGQSGDLAWKLVNAIEVRVQIVGTCEKRRSEQYEFKMFGKEKESKCLTVNNSLTPQLIEPGSSMMHSQDRVRIR